MVDQAMNWLAKCMALAVAALLLVGVHRGDIAAGVQAARAEA